VKRHAKATPAGSTEGSGNRRGLFRRASATSGTSKDPKRSGARSTDRLRATFAVLAVTIAAFAVTAASALAAQTHVFTGSFGTAGSGDGQLELGEHSGIAVDEASHDIYVTDNGVLA
jgi:hypothetical protein